MTKSRANFIALIITVAVAIVAVYGYTLLDQSGGHPFVFTGDSTPAESDAAKYVGTTQTETVSFVNCSEGTVKLWSIEFVNYKGLAISNVTMNGEPLRGQEIPSNPGDGKVATVTYQVRINSPTIQNPPTVLLTYSYWGIKHTQTLSLSP